MKKKSTEDQLKSAREGNRRLRADISIQKLENAKLKNLISRICQHHRDDCICEGCLATRLNGKH